MTITEESRHELYQRLEAVLGKEQAATLMEHLPPVGWADVATKRDLDTLQAATKRDLEVFQAATKRDMADLRTEMAKLRTEFKTEIASARIELHTAIRSAMFTVIGSIIGFMGVAAAIVGLVVGLVA